MLARHFNDGLHTDWIKFGAVQQSDDGNDNSLVMVLHFGMYKNPQGRWVQAQYRPSQVKAVMTSFTLAPTQQRPSSITFRLVDGPFDDEPAVQYVPKGSKNFTKHEWYRYIREHLLLDWSAAQDAAAERSEAAEQANADAKLAFGGGYDDEGMAGASAGKKGSGKLSQQVTEESDAEESDADEVPEGNQIPRDAEEEPEGDLIPRDAEDEPEGDRIPRDAEDEPEGDDREKVPRR